MQAKSTLVQNYLQQQKVIIVGKLATGKSSVIERYVNNKFSQVKQMTIGIDFSFKQIKYQEITYKLKLFDTAGQQKFAATNKKYYKGANGTILVFSLSQWFEKYKESNQFPLDKQVIYWLNQITEHNQIKDYDVVFFGNKYDLIQNQQKQEIQQFIKKVTQAFKPLCQQYKTKVYYGSAKTGQHIQQAFQQLIKHFYNKKEVIKKEASFILTEQSLQRQNIIQMICGYFARIFKRSSIQNKNQQ